MAAMLGGVVGQEVMKAASGKFHPLYQFFYFDSIESLPEETLSPEDVAPLVCHKSQSALLGVLPKHTACFLTVHLGFQVV